MVFFVYGANGNIGKYKDYNHKNRTNLYNLSWKYLWHGELRTKPMSWITANAMVINIDSIKIECTKIFISLSLCI